MKGGNYPVESHISGILENVMIRVSQDVNITMTRGTLRAEIAQGMLRVCRVTSESLIDLFIDDHVDLHASLGATLEDMVETPFLVLYRRAAEE